MNDAIYWSASAQARALRARELSSREMVDACLARIEVVNPAINAVVQLVAGRAQAEADELDSMAASGHFRGPLHGVPMTLKDSLDTAGIVSTGGTLGRRDFVPQQDAPVVARLRAAGAVLLGKTNTPELTLSGETNNLIYGRTNNPYDLAAVPGVAAGARRRSSPVAVRLWSLARTPEAASVNRHTCAVLPVSNQPRGERRAVVISYLTVGSWID